MPSFLKISDAASLAFHAMTYLAANPPSPIPANRIASDLGLSQAHLAKVFQRLAKHGLVRSTRGPKGGFALSKPADHITLLDIYEAIEGPMTTTSCLFGTPICGRSMCIFGAMLPKLSSEIRNYLAGTSLSQLVEGGSTNHGNTQEDSQDR